jgi:uncharacterized protein (DUF1499 family)
MPIVAPLSRWSSRLALFFVSLLLITLFVHRLGAMPTGLALNLFAVGFAGAGCAVLVGLAALGHIWHEGRAGALNVAVGILLPVLVFAVPAGYLAATHNLPRIHDVTTDFVSPPKFTRLPDRSADANSSAYPGADFAALQTRGYPDIRTLMVDRPVDEAFEVVEEVVRRLRWHVVLSEIRVSKPPVRIGTVEATDTTLLIGFVDDIAVRVEGTTTRTRIDIRSASRYGRFDFGQNAGRIRSFLAEVALRADISSPATVAGRRLRNARARATLKRQKARDQQKAGPRNVRGRGQ